MNQRANRLKFKKITQKTENKIMFKAENENKKEQEPWRKTMGAKKKRKKNEKRRRKK